MDNPEQDGSVYVSSSTLLGACLGVKLIRGGLSSIVSSIWATTGTSATGPLVSFMLGQAHSNIYKTVRGVMNVVGKGVANGLSYAEGILELSDGTNRKWDISTLTMRGTPVLHFDAAKAYRSIGMAFVVVCLMTREGCFCRWARIMKTRCIVAQRDEFVATPPLMGYLWGAA